MDWAIIQKLLISHQKTILKTQQDLKSLAELVDLQDEKDLLQKSLDEIKELESIVVDEFKQRGERISGLVRAHCDIYFPTTQLKKDDSRYTILSEFGTRKLLKTIARGWAVLLGYRSYSSHSLQYP